MNVPVTKICSKIRQAALRVDSLAIPRGHAVNDKGMTQIVNTRSAATDCCIHSSPADDVAQQLFSRDETVGSPLVPEYRRGTIARYACLLTSLQILGQCRHHSRRQGQPACLEEFAISDLNCSSNQVHVFEF